MASRDNPTTIPQPPRIDDRSQLAKSETGDGASFLSSRMTDITSEDGREQPAGSVTHSVGQTPGQRRSVQTNASRPNTGVSSQRGAWPQSPGSRRAYASTHSQRGSVSTTTSPRPQSGRSHVPSLTSHAFFRPMSSQRLQAQRGGARPPTSTQPSVSEGVSFEAGIGSSVNSNQTAKRGYDPDGPPPPSRGTEMTEQETAERFIANASPTLGHNAAGSLSESVRPLQRNPANKKGLNLALDKSYRNGNGLAVANSSKSPRSFRSSFLLPTRGDAAPSSLNRSTQGREKLSSVASSPALTPVDPLGRDLKDPKLGSNYEYFTGNTVFFWGGRFQNTRHRPINIATGILFIIPGVLFFVFSASWLWHNISPAIPIIFAYLFYLAFSSFVHASLSDPGILPRNLHPMPPPEENEDPLRLAPSTNDWTMIKSAQSATAAMEVPTKYCKTCNIWRPARGHHCRICDNCIETQDHHCVWINNCVGRRNYRYFFAFVSSGTLVGLYLMAASLAQILVYMKRQDVSFGAAIGHFRVPFAMIMYGAVGTPYLLALTVYHLFLMGRGETTREYLNSHKFLKKDRHRPFTQGNIIKNWFVVLCRPRPPTYLRFKDEYEDGDQRFGERRAKRTTRLARDVQARGGGGWRCKMSLLREVSKDRQH